MSVCIYSHEDGAYCDKHSHGAATLSCTGEDTCPDVQPFTNYDMILAKTPGELAEWLVDRDLDVVNKIVDAANVNSKIKYDKRKCVDDVADWLRSPVEVDDGT